MDIVYILGHGSIWNNNELRFSLRSVQKHLKGYKNIYIVGEKVDFLNGVIHVPCEDKGIFKEVNIFYKTLRAAQEPSVSENFLFMNDDHFFLQDFDIHSFPYFYKSTLDESINKMPDAVGGYWTPLRNCRSALQGRGLTTFDYDHHSPIVYNKDNIKKLETMYDWTIDRGYILKSLYGNTFGVQGQCEYDLKIKQGPSLEDLTDALKERKVFSIGDSAITPQFVQLMNSLYPYSSDWERDF